MSSSSPQQECRTQLCATVCAVPNPAPPFDDEVTTADSGDPDRGGEPGTTYTEATRTRPPAGPRDADHARATGHQQDRLQGLGQRIRQDLDSGGAWPSQFAQVLAETLAGSRPSRQLTRWTTERARTHIRRLGPLLAGSQGPQIRRIIASTPSSGVVEMAVVVRFGPRIRALAVRLERDSACGENASWRCTAIEAA